jgi:hypothetical protein
MKSLSRPFIILIVLGLSALSFALKTEDGVFTPASQWDEIYPSVNSEGAVELLFRQYQHGDPNSPKVNVEALFREPSYYVRSVSQPDSTIPVVVIPAALGGIEQIPLLFNAAVRELNIMCRLFDNQLKLASSANANLITDIYFYALSDLDSDPLQTFWGGKTRNTNCIYLEGYGALFLMRANIPLTASPQPVKPKEKPSQPVDKVWRNTESELYGSPNVQTDKSGKGYDTDTVEEFKTNIVKTLKHAANIKCLKSDDLVIVTVNGPQKKAGPPRVLIVRVKKSDIDEFSKGTLDLDGFREKVHIVAPPSSKRARGPEQATDKPDLAEGAEE